MDHSLRDDRVEANGCARVRSIRDIIDLWPSRKSMADDLEAAGAGGGDSVTAERVHKWAKRGAIPSIYHGRILRAAAGRGLVLTAADLVAAHDAPAPIPSQPDEAA